MSFTAQGNGNIFTSPGGYAIKRDGSESPAYWIAYRPGSNGKPCINPQHELGAGAGDQGWLKCVRLCEAHAQRELERQRQDGAAIDAVIAQSPKVNSTAKPSESSPSDAAPLQQGLKL